MIRGRICSVLAICLVGLSSTNAQEPRCFTSIIKPGGWEIPDHGRALKSGQFRRPGFPDGITFTDFALDPTKRIALSRHYIEKESLVLFSAWFHSDVLTRLEVKGKPFGYLMYATATYTGDAAPMWWLDRDGDGTFPEMQWNPDPRHLPKWVSRLLGSE